MHDPFARVALLLGLLLAAAWIGRWIATSLKQAPVVGELTMGVVLGNVGVLIGLPLATLLMHLTDAQHLVGLALGQGIPLHDAAAQVFSAQQLEPGGAGATIVRLLGQPGAMQDITLVMAASIFSSLGVVLLLFAVGFESEVSDMLRVGPRATAVAVVGVVVPFALGGVASRLLIPDAGLPTDLFIGAALVATSVGITARVFRDLGRLQTGEARVILGAAVIDDILGLVILAVVVGIVAEGRIDAWHVGRILGLSLALLGGMLWLGDRIVRALARWMHRRQPAYLRLHLPLLLGFLGAWAASLVGLATIVGAFAMGLVLSERQFRFEDETHEETVAKVIGPLEALFAPLFFVLMGMQVDLATFASLRTLALAAVLTVVGIAGKLVAGLVAGKDLDRLSVGIGMIPRGEVGLIFASIGKGLGVLDDGLFSAVVAMIIVTTLVTPLALQRALERGASRPA
jgi:Kef-type K+ transport system membrane component KefB